MRNFQLAQRPTERQLAAIVGAFRVLDVPRFGCYLSLEDDEADLPAWLARDGLVINMPGEPHRCPHCGELLGDEP